MSAKIKGIFLVLTQSIERLDNGRIKARNLITSALSEIDNYDTSNGLILGSFMNPFNPVDLSVVIHGFKRLKALGS